jgi:small GTP-binding protein
MWFIGFLSGDLKSSLKKPMNHINQLEPQYLQFNPKIVLLGAEAVGKSQFVRKLCSHTFSDDYSKTIGGCFQSKTLQTPQRPYSCHIWETSGQEKYHSLTPLYLKGAQSVLIFFSVGNYDSFYKAQDFLALARRECSPNAYISLVGTQSDLRLNPNNRLVGVFEAQEFAMRQGIDYIETSARNGINVNEVFEKAAGEVVFRVNNGLLEAVPTRRRSEGNGSFCSIF